MTRMFAICLASLPFFANAALAECSFMAGAHSSKAETVASGDNISYGNKVASGEAVGYGNKLAVGAVTGGDKDNGNPVTIGTGDE